MGVARGLQTCCGGLWKSCPTPAGQSPTARQAALIARATWAVLHTAVLGVLLTHEASELHQAIRSGDAAYLMGVAVLLAATAGLYAAAIRSEPGFADEDPMAKELARAALASGEGSGGGGDIEMARLPRRDLRGGSGPDDVAVQVAGEGGGRGTDGMMPPAAGGSEDEGDTVPLGAEHGAADLGGRVCQYCYVWQPLRAKHCHECERCVLRFDHHCFWVGGCVGANNHRVFLWYLAVQTAAVAWAASASLGMMRPRPTAERWLEDNALALLVALVACACLFFIFPLLCFHSFLAATNQTTYELTSRERVHYFRSVPSNVLAPFNRGVAANTRSFCLGGGGGEEDRMPSREELKAISESETFWDNRYYSCC